MRGKKGWIVLLVFAVVAMGTLSVEASVIINEIFADPPMGLLGDANSDGVRSSSADEFVELLNYGINVADISEWTISDSVLTRHVFPSNTILEPYTFLVVFGGGAPTLPDINWQIASSGSLGLNNSGDMVTLFNAQAQMIDRVVYGSIGGKDQSITRFPDGEGVEFALHSSLDEAQGALFSPGTSIASEVSLRFFKEEQPFDNTVVPELPALIYFGLGWGGLLFNRKVKHFYEKAFYLPDYSLFSFHRLRDGDRPVG